jgi:hypothetical protein
MSAPERSQPESTGPAAPGRGAGRTTSNTEDAVSTLIAGWAGSRTDLRRALCRSSLPADDRFSGGRGHPPRRGRMASCQPRSCEPRPAQGDERHRELPHGGPRRPRRTLRGLRPHTAIAYNSCRNRHCPKCQGAAACEWMAAWAAELLPVPYFHVVFTLPSDIADIAYQNKAVIYNLLFKASSETMLTIADPKHLGARIGITSVLQSWGSAMTHHPHVHMIVPGGGIANDGSRWISCKNPSQKSDGTARAVPRPAAPSIAEVAERQADTKVGLSRRPAERLVEHGGQADARAAPREQQSASTEAQSRRQHLDELESGGAGRRCSSTMPSVEVPAAERWSMAKPRPLRISRNHRESGSTRPLGPSFAGLGGIKKSTDGPSREGSRSMPSLPAWASHKPNPDL